MYKRTSIGLQADLVKILPVRREWRDIFKVTNGKNLQARILYPTRPLFRFEGEVKSFTD